MHKYSPILEERIRKHIKLTIDSWRMDETYIRIKGKNAYLYRAVDDLTPQKWSELKVVKSS